MGERETFFLGLGNECQHFIAAVVLPFAVVPTKSRELSLLSGLGTICAPCNPKNEMLF
jgi:hypothetical protein